MQTITTVGQLDDALNRPLALILKHSTRCPISSWALSLVQRVRQERADLPGFLIRVIEERPISDALSRQTQIEHESPQAMVVCSGRVAWHGSHFSIDEQTLAKEIDQIVATNR